MSNDDANQKAALAVERANFVTRVDTLRHSEIIRSGVARVPLETLRDINALLSRAIERLR